MLGANGLDFLLNDKSDTSTDDNSECANFNDVVNDDVLQVSEIAKNLSFVTQRCSLVASACVESAANKFDSPPSTSEPSTHVRIMITVLTTVAYIGLCCCIGTCFAEGSRRKGISAQARKKKCKESRC